MTREVTTGRARQVIAALFWAGTWGLGAAIGVALGSWLTVASGSGAPGIETLDITQDVIVLPSVAGGGVILLHLVWQILAHARVRHPSDEAGA